MQQTPIQLVVECIHFEFILSQGILVYVMAAKESIDLLGLHTIYEEWRTFTPQGSSQQSRFGNVYYHCSVPCVRAVWPSFIPHSVVVPFEVKTRLQPQHIDWLFANFGVVV